MSESILLQERLRKLKHVVLDMDGTIYLDEQLFEETKPFLRTLEELGVGYSFITNNNSRSRQEYCGVLAKMGLSVPANSLVTSAHATASYLETHFPQVRRPYVLGMAGLVDDMKLSGLNHTEDAPDAVVVGFDRNLTYDKLCQAAYWITTGLPYLATHPDKICPTKDETVLPDCAAICALLQTATGRAPDAVPGKPSPAMLEGLLQSLSLQPSELAMVGDRLYTDVKMANLAGAFGVLTLTGEATQVDVANSGVQPDLVISNLGEFSSQIMASRQLAD